MSERLAVKLRVGQVVLSGSVTRAGVLWTMWAHAYPDVVETGRDITKVRAALEKRLERTR